MRLVQNFNEAPVPDVMAKSVLAALAKEDYSRAAALACTAAHNCGVGAFFELNALCATTLARAGQADVALEYWDKIIRSAPHKLNYLEAAIVTASQCAREAAKKHFDNWIKLLERVYINTPGARFLSLLNARGCRVVGSAGISEGAIKGWVWSASAPELFVECPRNVDANMRLEPVEQCGDHVLYKLECPLPEKAVSLKVNILVKGRHIEGSPVTVSPARIECPIRAASGSNTLSIIIPVYDDYAATMQCIATVFASLRRNRNKPRIIVVWDNGPNTKLITQLRKLAARGKLELIENPHNLGFLASVNCALAHTRGDVILLNADTLVHGDWIDRLANAADREDAATVTALGNEAELMSYPSYKDRGKISSLAEVKILDQAASELEATRAVLELPVGVGFCMYITRRAINAIGGLDGRNLFRGYGEETDYCLRACDAGLKNYGAFNVFVGHLGEKSFGIGKKALAAQNNETISKKYPGHRRQYDIFVMSVEPARIREEISRNVLRKTGLKGELELRPWSARHLPPWIRDSIHESKKRGAVLFLQPGKNPRALLRVWQDLPFADMRFDLRKDCAALISLMQEGGIKRAKSFLKTEPLRRLARELELDLEESHALAELPELEKSLSEPILTTPPESMADWQALTRLAKQNPSSLFYVFQLGTVCGKAPRPVNVRELPLLDNYSPLGIRKCLLWKQTDLSGWPDWLASHGCTEIKFFRDCGNV